MRDIGNCKEVVKWVWPKLKLDIRIGPVINVTTAPFFTL